MTLDVHMSDPPSRTQEFFPSPALSLSLAGVFRGAVLAAPPASDGEEGDGESGGGSRGEAVEISSENTGPLRSDEDPDSDGILGFGYERGNQKKQKRYHRHTAEQIREMEALFKESPHPDEKQRQQLSKQLGLAPRQIKFWFQNRRTQIKAIQERHENALLKAEIEKLREENKNLRETPKRTSCPNCGFSTTTLNVPLTNEEQQLRIENANLKAEIERLKKEAGGFARAPPSPTSSCSAGNERESRSGFDYCAGLFGIEKPRILERCSVAMEELKVMATAGEPLWLKSVETGREILNYDEYIRRFPPENVTGGCLRRSIEASRTSGVVFIDMHGLIEAFMDVNRWREMFSAMVYKAANVGAICNGEGDGRDGAAQLMFAEIQMLTPVVATREIYFIRHLKQLSSDSWAILDVSVHKLEDNVDPSLGRCRKQPSGCIIQDKCNGHCQVTWVEHVEWHRSSTPTLYRSVVNSGLAFGAKHWVATLQNQCERFAFFMATNVPTKDSSGVGTLAGRRSVLKLAQRMSSNFCRMLGASSQSWSRVTNKEGHDIRVSSRKNLNDPGEPMGTILCAAMSVSLPVPPKLLFDFLRDDIRKNEWDLLSVGGPFHSIANLAKGQDRGNSVTIHAPSSKEGSMWILQDSCTNSFEAMVIYAPVDVTSLQSVMTGCDSSSVAVLPSGYSILPDGLESRTMVTTSVTEEGGSLLTMAFQMLVNDSSHTAKLGMESVEIVSTLLSCSLDKIKAGLECELG